MINNNYTLLSQVVYNLSVGESELDSLLSWLLNIQACAPASLVIVVGTHIDKIPPGGRG